ncbi:hypothetical protein [Bacillus sp. SG-1]|uniref:hypothetical protein n=1 Tax=Bacillus sp. SG-1 TaxID=161544 RepID=UPI0001543112|nr:hypothetical protein [Bacillus sp. SG-1]EDL65792.1 hypothetical protein BSG1_16090 [Bacillus sp. SG-1]
MEKNNKPTTPDFDSLDDRVIASAPSNPSLVIKTNLDPDSVEEENPYFQKDQQRDPKKFKDYFKE